MFVDSDASPIVALELELMTMSKIKVFVGDLTQDPTGRRSQNTNIRNSTDMLMLSPTMLPGVQIIDDSTLGDLRRRKKKWYRKVWREVKRVVVQVFNAYLKMDCDCFDPSLGLVV